jgi:hypothetical protein
VRHAPEETILAALNFGDHSIDRVKIAMAAALRGRLFRLEPLYSDPSSACRVILVEDGAVTLGAVAAHSLCVFSVLDR